MVFMLCRDFNRNGALRQSPEQAPVRGAAELLMSFS
jgi:hypothetical protein